MTEQERIGFAPTFGEVIKVIILRGAFEIRSPTTVILQEGYRHIDAAWYYRKQAGKRNGMQLKSRVRRD